MWKFPIENCKLIPIGEHPGAFGVKRKRFYHTGVDLYTENHEIVYAVEDGIIVNLGLFTGPKLGHDHWESTDFLMVEGESGVVNYGEISVSPWCRLGFQIKKGDAIGFVKQVLPNGKIRLDIPGHSLSMLHLELYTHRSTTCVDWTIDQFCPVNLLDPTSYLLKANRFKHACELSHGD